MRKEEEVLYSEGRAVLEFLAKRDCGCTVCGNVPGQVGLWPRQSDLLGGNPVHGRRLKLHEL